MGEYKDFDGQDWIKGIGSLVDLFQYQVSMRICIPPFVFRLLKMRRYRVAWVYCTWIIFVANMKIIREKINWT